MSECLLADHHHSNRGQIALAATSLNGGYNARSKEEYDHLLTKKLKRRYQGCGSNSINAIRGTTLSSFVLFYIMNSRFLRTLDTPFCHFFTMNSLLTHFLPTFSPPIFPCHLCL